MAQFSFLLFSGAILLVSAELNDTSDVVTPCANPPPGLAILTHGIDITKLDLTPSVTSKSQLDPKNGFLAPIFVQSCNLNHTGKHSKADNSTKYDIPDQLGSFANIPVRVKASSIKSHYFGCLRVYRAFLGGLVGLDGAKLPVGSFSAVDGYRKALEEVFAVNRTIAETFTALTAWQFQFLPATQQTLHPDFLASITGLPDSFESAPESYLKVLDQYGTHFFARGYLGAFIYQKSVVAKDSNQTEILQNSKAKFLKLFPSLNSSSNLVENEIKTETFYYGINQTELSADQSTWLDVILKNPWLFGGELLPIEDLASAQNQTSTKSAELRRASKLKLTKAYLDQVKIQTVGRNLPQEDQQRLDRIQELFANYPKVDETILRSETELERIGADLDLVFDQINGVKCGAKN